MLNIFIYTIAGLLSLAGIVLTVVSFPGIWLIYISTLMVAILDNFQVITPTILIVLFVIAVLSTLVDNIVIALGAKKLGGTGWGMAGGIIGGIVGLIVGNLVGMFVGPLIGATLFELVFAHKDINQSFKAGIGSFIGIFVSIVLKIGINVGIIVYVISRLL